jgi:hypothetical protein
MAVDFYSINDKDFKTILFSLNNQDFELLEPALSEYKKKTGLIIDQYDDTIISIEHTRLIADLIEKNLGDSKSKSRLLEIRDKFRNNNADLLALGD